MSAAYARPESLEAALELRAEEGCVPLAGGTDLTTLRAERRVVPATVLDLKAVPGLGAASAGGNGGAEVTVGALANFASLAALGGNGIDAVTDGSAIVGSAQTRRRATIGGNVCRSSPAGDSLPGLLALGAGMRAASLRGEREIAAEDFFTAPGENSLAADELLTALRIPRWSGSAYRRLTYRNWMDLAVIGVAVALELEGGRCAAAAFALGGVAPTPILVEPAAAALVGSELEEGAVASAAAELVAAASPIDDVRGSREYRLGGIEPLARKAIETARQRATAPRRKED